MSDIYLASKSPRRQELLRQIGVSFELMLPSDEQAAEALEALRSGESPSQYVQRVTLAKMQFALQTWTSQALAPKLILTADTTVALGSQILGKPETRAAAKTMLEKLSGRSHKVFTAVAVANPAKQNLQMQLKLSASKVQFKRLSKLDIQTYLDSGEGQDKAGGYAIQGLAAGFIRKIEGSYSGIMGLPLFETCQLLKR